MQLSIHKLIAWVILGCYSAEQTQTQPIEIDIVLNFHTAPPGCFTDQLSDSCCYDSLCQVLLEQLEHKTFNLVERVAAYIAELIAAHLVNFPYLKTIEVQVTKKRLEIQALRQGVSFKYIKEIK